MMSGAEAILLVEQFTEIIVIRTNIITMSSERAITGDLWFGLWTKTSVDGRRKGPTCIQSNPLPVALAWLSVIASYIYNIQYTIIHNTKCMNYFIFIAC